MQMLAVRQGHFVIGDVVQFVMHVTHRVAVDQRGDEGHHAEHGDRERVDVVADRQLQLAELTQRVKRAGVVRIGGVCVAVTVVAFGVGGIAVSCIGGMIVRLLRLFQLERDKGRAGSRAAE